MSIKERALAAVVTYLEAHEAFNKAQNGANAKAKRDAHSALIQAAELYRPQHKPQHKPER